MENWIWIVVVAVVVFFLVLPELGKTYFRTRKISAADERKMRKKANAELKERKLEEVISEIDAEIESLKPKSNKVMYGWHPTPAATGWRMDRKLLHCVRYREIVLEAAEKRSLES